MIKIVLLIILILPNFVLGRSLADFKLSEAAIYYRCHSQFSRKRPTENDAYLKLIKEKKISSTEACMKIIDESNMDGSGKLLSSSLVNDRAMLTLRTFQLFHMSWFPNKDFVRQEVENSTTNLFDANEMGYNLTYNLFGPKVKYSEIVTRSTSFRGVRDQSNSATYLLDPRSDGGYELLTKFKWGLGVEKNVQLVWNPTLIQFGKLTGLKPLLAKENMASHYHAPDKIKLNFSVSSSLGGGILGNASYLMLSSNLKLNESSDGGLNMHRSWSKAIFSDLLCRNLPVIRKEDAIFSVQKNSSIPFRKEESCMQCHASMDPMASTIRNVLFTNLADFNKNYFSPRSIVIFQTSEKREYFNSLDTDSKFHLRPPNGKLYYRNYNGILVDKNVSGVKELGAALAGTDDLYLCAAKRYFEFLTGVNVHVEDFSIEKNKLNPKTLKYRNFVIELGKQLKKNQSLKTLIRNIIDSPYYKLSDYGASS